MKKFFYLLSLTLLFWGNLWSQEISNSPKITYSAQSRGLYKKWVFQEKKVLVFGRNDVLENERIIPSKVWKKMILAIEKLELDKISDWQAPSQKRLFDGAPSANIIIEKGGKAYQSNGFDHGNPPAKLSKILSVLKDFIQI